jgi:hypothetical protein
MDDDDDTLLEEINIQQTLINLKIFDRQNPQEPIPEGFTAANILVDARPASSLNWTKETQEAELLIKNGYRICFELDFGLFGPTFKGIAHQGQFQTIVLALDEFRNRLLNRFEEHVEAVILYRSTCPFTSIHERDIQMDYLDLLRQELPDTLITLLLFDCTSMQDAFSFARLFSPDRFSLFTLALTNAPLLLSSACWNNGNALLGYIGRDLAQNTPKKCSKGLLLPRFTSNSDSLKPLLDSLVTNNELFKIISEDNLALEWDGLDVLYVQKTCLEATSLRMIDGFIAAGGVVIDQNPLESI